MSVSVSINLSLWFPCLYVLFNVSFILSFLLYTLFYCRFFLFFFVQELFWISFQWGILQNFIFQRAHNKCSWHFYVFKLLLVLCVRVCVLCRFVCSLSLSSYICALSPSLGKKGSVFHNGQWKGHFRRSSSFKVTTTMPLCFIFDPTCTVNCVYGGGGSNGLLCRVGDCNLMPLQAIPSPAALRNFYCRRVSLSIFNAFYANLSALTLSHFNGKQSASEIWRMCRKVKCSAQRFRLPISLGYFGNTLDLSFSQVEAHYAYVRLHTRDKASLSLARSLWHCATLL